LFGMNWKFASNSCSHYYDHFIDSKTTYYNNKQSGRPYP
jgi:hypothetical protein